MTWYVNNSEPSVFLVSSGPGAEYTTRNQSTMAAPKPVIIYQVAYVDEGSIWCLSAPTANKGDCIRELVTAALENPLSDMSMVYLLRDDRNTRDSLCASKPGDVFEYKDEDDSMYERYKDHVTFRVGKEKFGDLYLRVFIELNKGSEDLLCDEDFLEWVGWLTSEDEWYEINKWKVYV
jgi:hypothetical protein